MGDDYTSDMDDRGDISEMLDINLHRRRKGLRPLTVEEMRGRKIRCPHCGSEIALGEQDDQDGED